jgi:hypothetical protein
VMTKAVVPRTAVHVELLRITRTVLGHVRGNHMIALLCSCNEVQRDCGSAAVTRHSRPSSERERTSARAGPSRNQFLRVPQAPWTRMIA